jgi:hypothetical protein
MSDDPLDDPLPENAGLIYYEPLPAQCLVTIPVLSEHLRHGDVIARLCDGDDVPDFAAVLDFDGNGPVFGFLEIRGSNVVPIRVFKDSPFWAWRGEELDLAYHILEPAPARDHEDHDYRMPETELNQRLALYRDLIGRRESPLPEQLRAKPEAAQ